MYSSLVFNISSCASYSKKYIYPENTYNTQLKNFYNDTTSNETIKYFSYVDTTKISKFKLNNFIILQSVLKGPSGKASNFYHYLIYDTISMKSLTFMSLSNNINNIFCYNNSVYINMVDYKEDVFDDEAYFENKESVFNIFYTLLDLEKEELQIISKKVIKIKWEKVFSLRISHVATT